MLSDFHPFEIATTLAGGYFPNARKITKSNGHVIFYMGRLSITIAPSGNGVSFTLARNSMFSGMLVSNPVDNFETHKPKEAALWLATTHSRIVSETLDMGWIAFENQFPWYGEKEDYLSDVHTLWVCGLTIHKVLTAPDSKGEIVGRSFSWRKTLHRTGQTIAHTVITSQDNVYKTTIAYNADSDPVKWSAKVDLPSCISFPETQAKVSGEIPRAPDSEVGNNVLALALEPLWQRMVFMSKIHVLNRFTSTA